RMWAWIPSIPRFADAASAICSSWASCGSMPSHQPSPAPRSGAPRFWTWMLGALAIIVLDQATKAYFDSQLSYGERWHLLPFFDFTLLYNPGAAFSFLADGQGWQRWFFTAVALGAT